MKTLTALLASFQEHKAARFRGLVLSQLVRAAQASAEPGLLHLFLLPPQPGQTRFALYQTTQPLNLDVPIREAIRQVLDTLGRFDGDPRVVPGVDQRWRDVDAGQQALYLGTGARFASVNPQLAGTTITRLVDHTAFYLTLGPDQRPIVLHASQPVILHDEPIPAAHIPAIKDPPFVLIDTVVRFLR